MLTVTAERWHGKLYRYVQHRAFVDSMIYERGPSSFCHYISVWGKSQDVEAVWESMRRGECSTVTSENTKRFLWLRFNLRKRESRVMVKRLPGNLVHVLYVNATLMPRQGTCVVWGRTEEEMIDRAFRIVDLFSPIPLRESWKHWLWEHVLRPRTEELSSHGEQFAHARLLRPPADRKLHAAIAENLNTLKNL